MSACAMMILAKDPELRQQFRMDPLEAIKILSRVCNTAPRLTAADIELIKSFTDEEFEMFYGVTEKMKQLKLPNFKL